jgi:hypothetical protein
MEPTLAEAFARALGPIREQALLVRSELGSDAQLIGAAEVAFADVLEDPLGTLDARRGGGDGADDDVTEVPRPRSVGTQRSASR